MLDDVREHQEHAAEAWLLLRRGLVPGEGACTVDMCLIERPQVGHVPNTSPLSADMIRYEALSSEVALFMGYRYSPARGTRDDYTHAR